MRKPRMIANRAEELRAMLAAYRSMTIEEIEDGEWGDLAVELEGELWQLEQELFDRRQRPPKAA